ncbi:MAG: hypothetical protein OXK80_00470 [Bdellovibrionales bacterium]|nr:hypothetical protein [Bdellovibrionales bacterium]
MKETKHKIYRDSVENWFYQKFIKNTVNDNFVTPAEALDKDSNQDLMRKINTKIKINGK